MTQFRSSVVASLLLVACATVPDLSSVEAEIVHSGLYTDAVNGADYQAASVVASQSVPYRAGDVFGATFKLSGWPVGTRHLPYQAVWNHPPIREPGQGPLVERAVNNYDIDGFEFPDFLELEVPELWRLEAPELQNGTWTIKLFVDGRPIARSQFEISDCPGSAKG